MAYRHSLYICSLLCYDNFAFQCSYRQKTRQPCIDYRLGGAVMNRPQWICGITCTWPTCQAALYILQWTWWSWYEYAGPK